MAAENEEKETACAGYKHGPPWVFKGRQGPQLSFPFFFFFSSFPPPVRSSQCVMDDG